MLLSDAGVIVDPTQKIFPQKIIEKQSQLNQQQKMIESISKSNLQNFDDKLKRKTKLFGNNENKMNQIYSTNSATMTRGAYSQGQNIDLTQVNEPNFRVEENISDESHHWKSQNINSDDYWNDQGNILDPIISFSTARNDAQSQYNQSLSNTTSSASTVEYYSPSNCNNINDFSIHRTRSDQALHYTTLTRPATFSKSQRTTPVNAVIDNYDNIRDLLHHRVSPQSCNPRTLLTTSSQSFTENSTPGPSSNQRISHNFTDSEDTDCDDKENSLSENIYGTEAQIYSRLFPLESNFLIMVNFFFFKFKSDRLPIFF